MNRFEFQKFENKTARFSWWNGQSIYSRGKNNIYLYSKPGTQNNIPHNSQVGIPAIGFTPINNTPVLLHDHDEFIRADTYLDGIEIYKKLITKIANV